MRSISTHRWFVGGATEYFSRQMWTTVVGPYTCVHLAKGIIHTVKYKLLSSYVSWCLWQFCSKPLRAGATHYLNHLPVIHEAIGGGTVATADASSSFEGSGGVLFQFEADPPTVTMQVCELKMPVRSVYQVYYLCELAQVRQHS